MSKSKMITVPPPRKGEINYVYMSDGSVIVYEIIKVIKPKKAGKK